MYYLDELAKDEFNYLKNCKETMKKYFTKFFGEKYFNQISERIDITSIICVNDKINVAIVDLIDDEIDLLLDKWFSNICKAKINKENKSHYYNGLRAIANMLNSGYYDTVAGIIISNFTNDATLSNNKFFLEELKNSYESKYAHIINSLKKIKKELKDSKEFKNLLEDVDNEAYEMLTYLTETQGKEVLNKCKFQLKNNVYIKEILSNYKGENKEYVKQVMTEVLFSFFNPLNAKEIAFQYQSQQNANGVFIDCCIFPNAKYLNTNIFVHELTHVISKSLKIVGDKVISKNGIEFDSTDDDRKYALFNEILTDYYADIIVRQMEKDNVNLFLQAKTLSSYSLAFPLVENLLNKHLDLFKTCYISKDLRLEKIVGKENLKNLDELCVNYISYARTLIKTKKPLIDSYLDGLKYAKNMNIDNLTGTEIKYYNCFLKMEELSNKIDNKIENYNAKINAL